MSLSDSHLLALISKHKDDYEQYAIDKVSDTEWYVGFNENVNALKSEDTWYIYQLVNSGNTIDVASCGNKFDCIFNNKENLNYLPFSNLQFVGDTELLPNAIIDDVIGSFSFSSGSEPFTYLVVEDLLDKFKIVEGELKYKNTVAIGEVPVLKVSVTDKNGAKIEETFNFTVQTFSSTKSLKHDGINEYGKSVYAANQNVQEFSIVARIKFPASTGLPTGTQTIFSRGLYTGSENKCLSFEIHNNAQPYLNTSDDGNAILSAWSNNKLIVDTWHTVIATYQASGVNFFIDGLGQVSPSSGHKTPLFNPTMYGFCVGANHIGSYNKLKGLCHSIGFYGKVLNQAEIDLVSAAKPIDLKADSSPNGIVSYYRGGHTIVDVGGGVFHIPDEMGGPPLVCNSMTEANIEEDAPSEI